MSAGDAAPGLAAGRATGRAAGAGAAACAGAEAAGAATATAAGATAGAAAGAAAGTAAEAAAGAAARTAAGTAAEAAARTATGAAAGAAAGAGAAGAARSAAATPGGTGAAGPATDAQSARPAWARGWAVAAMVGSAACWGLATVLTKGALAVMPPFSLLVVQLSASVAFLWAAVAVTGQSARGAGRAALAGVLEPGLAYGAGVPGLMLTSAASASVIGAAEPMFIAALAWAAFGLRPSAPVAVAMLTGALGVALVTAMGAEAGERRLAGDLLVLLGTVFAAVYVLVSSRSVQAVAPLPLAAAQQSAGLGFAVVLAAGAMLAGLEPPPAAVTSAGVAPGALALAAASGVVQYALAFWLYLLGLRALPVATAAVFLALIPVFGVGGAMLFLGEGVAPAQGLGCALVIAAVLLAARRG